MRKWKSYRLLYGMTGNPMAYTNKVIALSPIAYWPLAEPSGTTIVDESGNARNGTYTAATLGTTGVGDGRTAATFDGTTAFGNIFSASLQGAFNSAEGTLAVWLQVSGAGVWTDATTRRIFYLQADSNNRVYVERTATNNQLSGKYTAGATTKTVNWTTSAPTGWTHIAITWSKAADQVILYGNGAQIGATQTGLGVWVGNLAATTTVLAAASTVPGNPWSGNLAHAAIWTTPLTSTQVTALATVP